jgi:hypothetical protein
MAEKKEPEEGARAFNVVFAELCSGAAHEEATDELHALLQALRVAAELRGPKGEAKGSLTIKLDLCVEAKGVAQVKYDISRKAPKPDREDDSFFLTRHSNLTRKNQKQLELGLRDVSATDKKGDVEDGAGVSGL